MSLYVNFPFKRTADGQYRTTFTNPIKLPGNDWHVALTSMRYCGERFSFMLEDDRKIETKFLWQPYKDFLTRYDTTGMLTVRVKIDDGTYYQSYTMTPANYTRYQLLNEICNAINADTSSNHIIASHDVGLLTFNTDASKPYNIIRISFSDALSDVLFEADSGEHDIASDSSIDADIPTVAGQHLEDIGKYKVIIKKPQTRASAKLKDKPIFAFPACRDYIEVYDNTLKASMDLTVSANARSGAITRRTNFWQIPIGSWPVAVVEAELGRVFDTKVSITLQNIVGGSSNYEQLGILTIYPAKSATVQRKMILSEEFVNFFNLPRKFGNIYQGSEDNALDVTVYHYFPIKWRVFIPDSSTVTIESKSLSNIEAVCWAITKACREVYNVNSQELKGAQFTYENERIKVVIDELVHIKLTSRLMELLGLSEWKNQWLTKRQYTGEVISEINIDAVHTFAILTNIIDYQHVSSSDGGKMIPLLRDVPNNAQVQVWCNESLGEQYKHVNTNNISFVEFRVCKNDTLEPLSFSNEVSFTLHFKQYT